MCCLILMDQPFSRRTRLTPRQALAALGVGATGGAFYNAGARSSKGKGRAVKRRRVTGGSGQLPSFGMPLEYGRSGKYFKRRKRRVKRKSRWHKKVRKNALKASLSLCEQKKLVAVERFCTLGHNIPQFFTGGLNIAYLSNEEQCWTDTIGTGPEWLPLIVSNGQGIMPQGGAPGMRPVGRYAWKSGDWGAIGGVPTNPNITFFNGNGGQWLHGREGNEVCPSKLVYKIEFMASQAYAQAGVSAKYTCYLFKYKVATERPSKYPDPIIVAESIQQPAALANVDPCTSVGRNQYLMANHAFNGNYGIGANPFEDYRTNPNYGPGGSVVGGVPPASPVNGNLPAYTGREVTEVQLTRNNNWQRGSGLIIVDKKEFSFDQAQPTNTRTQSVGDASSQAPLHTNTVYLSHKFKPGEKLDYMLRRQTDSETTGNVPTLIQGICPSGYNYGVCIVGSAPEMTVLDGNRTNMSHPPNYQWLNTPSQTETGEGNNIGRLCTYHIKKSFYFKDP